MAWLDWGCVYFHQHQQPLCQSITYTIFTCRNMDLKDLQALTINMKQTHTILVCLAMVAYFPVFEYSFEEMLLSLQKKSNFSIHNFCHSSLLSTVFQTVWFNNNILYSRLFQGFYLSYWWRCPTPSQQETADRSIRNRFSYLCFAFYILFPATVHQHMLHQHKIITSICYISTKKCNHYQHKLQ